MHPNSTEQAKSGARLTFDRSDAVAVGQFLAGSRVTEMTAIDAAFLYRRAVRLREFRRADLDLPFPPARISRILRILSDRGFVHLVRDDLDERQGHWEPDIEAEGDRLTIAGWDARGCRLEIEYELLHRVMFGDVQAERVR